MELKCFCKICIYLKKQLRSFFILYLNVKSFIQSLCHVKRTNLKNAAQSVEPMLTSTNGQVMNLHVRPDGSYLV